MNHGEAVRRIGVVGASARALAASAGQAGFQVVAADQFADLDLRRLAPTTQLCRYPWSAAAWLAEADVDAWCYTGGLENYPRLIQRMARLKPLLGNGAETLRRVRDPFWLAERLTTHGFAFPESRRADDAALLISHDSWLRKPWRSGGGLHVEPAAVAASSPIPHYLQRQIAGEPRSAAWLSSAKGVELIGVCRLAVGPAGGAPGPFGFAGATTLPLDEVAEKDELHALARLLHESAGLRGVWGLDYVLAERAWLLEVNPRWTATMALHERARAWSTADSLLGRHVAACLGTTRPHLPTPHLPAACGRQAMRIVYAAADVSVTAALIERLERTPVAEGGADSSDSAVADLPVPGSRISAGQPLCTVYAAGDTDAETTRRLARLVGQVCQAVDLG